MRRLRSIRLVAMREILERGRSRGYLLSLVFTVFLLVAGFLLPAFLLGRDETPNLALVGTPPAGLDRVRRKLVGAADGDRQFVDILTAVLSDGLPAVEAACQEALAQGIHSADVILNILARRREPAAPLTIATPDALRLRHAPAADCARYDRLRRAV